MVLSMKVHPILERYFKLDGGAMHGVVPRVMWERVHPPDSRGRIRLAARPLLIEADGRLILVDGGIGNAYPDRLIDMFGIEEGPGLAAELGRLGFSPSDVTDVIITHLHFDHIGGFWDRARGFVLEGTKFHVQRSHWQWAHAPSPKDRASFLPEHLEALAPHVELHDGGYELAGVEVLVLGGHTVGLQAVVVHDTDRGTVVYPSDTIPTRAHLKRAWGMAYDNDPLTLIEEKSRLLSLVVEDRGWLFLEHEPGEPWVRWDHLP